MTLDLLESTELDYIDFWCIYRGGSRISGKWVHMYKDVGFTFLILFHFFLNIPWKWNNLASLRANYFIFIGYLKTRGGGPSEPPEPHLDLPLI